MTFEKIQGGDFSFIKDDKIKNAIDNAGKRIIVFVEGYDDKIIFEIFFYEYNNKVTFIDVNGCGKVEKYVEDCVRELKKEEVYFGIIDRDFRADNEIEQKTVDSKYNNKLFIFKERYTIENYLIEDNILLNFLKRKNKKYEDCTLEQIKILIEKTFKLLIPISIGNFVLLKHGKEFFPKDAKIIPENCIALRVAKEIYEENCTEDNKKIIAEEIEKYQRNFDLNYGNNYHKFISGKYFFVYFGSEVGFTNFKNELDNLAGILTSQFTTAIPKEISQDIPKFIGLITN